MNLVKLNHLGLKKPHFCVVVSVFGIRSYKIKLIWIGQTLGNLVATKVMVFLCQKWPKCSFLSGRMSERFISAFPRGLGRAKYLIILQPSFPAQNTKTTKTQRCFDKK